MGEIHVRQQFLGRKEEGGAKNKTKQNSPAIKKLLAAFHNSS